ncbi:hypothetical protein [Pseudoalteromonas phenolica]|uniref:hypothetical protein n=1 Tax=Pseudoalteromonas phenolica TaxID=161398 RepID=UPI00110BDF17|nr:hypothetical protein [Pseudoalteromonas phenolica]TMO53470.1 hypothetical protein CWC21_19650 [Pseudoalteromonas phenolica]
MSTTKDLQQKLKQLNEYLLQKRVIKDEGPILAACNQLKRDSKRCRIQGLELSSIVGEYIRADWESPLEVKLSIDIEIKNEFKYQDVKKIIVNLEYSALHTHDKRECKGAWHFDYHVDMEGTGEAETYKKVHPHYHVHHGGNRLKDLNTYGDLILLKTPRLMHHPLDVFLAIDLALSNFLPFDLWTKLRADTGYQIILKDSQLKWWKPYYENLGNYWNNRKGKGKLDIAETKKSLELNPHLL